MSGGIILADIGNIGLAACAALDTAGVIAYALRARGGEHGRWWKTTFGMHLMCFMAAFAVVLDQSVIYLLTGPGLLAARALPSDWFAWERTLSFAVLIPAVLAWRLYLILRPPRRLGGNLMKALAGLGPVMRYVVTAALAGLTAAYAYYPSVKWLPIAIEEGATRRLNSDHDHLTGQQRGLLCSRCNMALGLMADDPALLRRAASYVEEYRQCEA